MIDSFGGVGDVVAPVGGWWAGRSLWEIGSADWDADPAQASREVDLADNASAQAVLAGLLR